MKTASQISIDLRINKSTVAYRITTRKIKGKKINGVCHYSPEQESEIARFGVRGRPTAKGMK